MTNENGTAYLIESRPEDRTRLVEAVSSIGLDYQEFESLGAFMQCMPLKRPACVVFDYAQHGIDGLDLVDTLAKQSVAPVPSIIISDRIDVPTAVRFMSLGAIGVLEKPFRQDELHDFIRRGIRRDIDQWELVQRYNELQNAVEQLTDSEASTLDLVRQGLTNKSIANQMNISSRTVELNRARILHKFGVSNVAALGFRYGELECLRRRFGKRD